MGYKIRAVIHNLIAGRFEMAISKLETIECDIEHK